MWVRLHLKHGLRRALYTVLALAWSSGISFYLLSRFVTIEGEFGPQKHPWQYPVLQLHGACAFLLLMSAGALLLNHIPVAWRTARSRVSGLLLTSLVATMVLSAWCLYYVGDDEVRGWLANGHAACGVTLPLLLAWHVIVGRRHAPSRSQERGTGPAPKS
ncbi:MAG: hypothetical protein KDI51_15360 [Xanthomonadales bacterium]|nr:hypothetical protein [Xanthomonadales bacterium]MCB1635965.1 hypothetical protein [Xanthomonadales bacterium]